MSSTFEYIHRGDAESTEVAQRIETKAALAVETSVVSFRSEKGDQHAVES